MSVFLYILLIFNVAIASDSSSCPRVYERLNGTKIQQVWGQESQACYFTVTPENGYVDLVYRDFLFSTTGLFLVFNSYGPGHPSEKVAAREFYMFPVINSAFTYSLSPDGSELEVQHVTGDRFIFDTAKTYLKSISRAEVTVADYVDPKNRGGVEISKYQGLLLDGGFKIGNSPTANPNGRSEFKDSRNKVCSVKNSEIFKYRSDGEIIFKFDTTGLAEFLKKRCPQLKGL